MSDRIIDDRYNYDLPESQIARVPAEPRDSCKLLVVNSSTNELTVTRFSDIQKHLPKNSFLVLNNTHVVPARLYCSSPTKQRVEVFILANEIQPSDILIRCMVDRKIRVGELLKILGAESDSESFEVISQDRQYFMLKPRFPLTLLTEILQKFGTTPLPHYITGTPLSETELRNKYQTVFAEPHNDTITRSVAAPTASLHFTDTLLKKLAEAGITQEKVTLHVGLGTFAPLTQENLTSKTLFHELYEVSDSSAAALIANKHSGRSLVAVGTTAVRTLESYARTPAYANKRGIATSTNIFIFPPFEFKLVDALVTNFHLPNSSLMMLVDAFLKSKNITIPIKDIYTFALKNDFKFYSFGDSMLIV